MLNRGTKGFIAHWFWLQEVSLWLMIQRSRWLQLLSNIIGEGRNKWKKKCKLSTICGHHPDYYHPHLTEIIIDLFTSSSSRCLVKSSEFRTTLVQNIECILSEKCQLVQSINEAEWCVCLLDKVGQPCVCVLPQVWGRILPTTDSMSVADYQNHNRVPSKRSTR